MKCKRMRLTWKVKRRGNEKDEEETYTRIKRAEDWVKITQTHPTKYKCRISRFSISLLHFFLFLWCCNICLTCASCGLQVTEHKPNNFDPSDSCHHTRGMQPQQSDTNRSTVCLFSLTRFVLFLFFFSLSASCHLPAASYSGQRQLASLVPFFSDHFQPITCAYTWRRWEQSNSSNSQEWQRKRKTARDSFFFFSFYCFSFFSLSITRTLEGA